MSASTHASSSRSAQAAASSSSAADELDAHLVSLLHTADAYAASQQAAAAHLARAFLSLSRARMHLGALGASSLLGADGADARLKAGVRCRVDDAGRMRLVRSAPSTSEAPASAAEKKLAAPERLRRRPRADAALDEKQNAASPEKEAASRAAAVEQDEKASLDINAGNKKSDAPPSKPKRPPQAPDPLYQFSALPPPALRSAQKSFIAALDELLGARGGAEGAWQSVQRLAQLEHDVADARRRAGEKDTATQ